MNKILKVSIVTGLLVTSMLFTGCSDDKKTSGDAKNTANTPYKDQKSVGTVKVEIGTGTETGKAGSDIKIPIKFTGVKDINNINFALKYDDKVFKMKSYKAGEIIPESQVEKFNSNSPVGGKAIVIWTDGTQSKYPINKDGVFGELILTVDAAAKDGEYKITAVPKNDTKEGWDCANQQLAPIDLSFNEGKITIKN